MRSLYLAGASALLLASTALAQNAAPAGGAPGGGRGPAGTNVTGTIQSVVGTMVTIKAADGSVKTAALAPTATFSTSQKVKLSDIKPNDFIATGGTLGPDGKIHSNEIRIFPEANRGRGEGSYPMAQAGQVMTNATVTQVISVPAGGGTMKMSFKGSIGADGKCSGRAGVADAAPCTGTTDIEVAPDIIVNRQGVGDASMLKAGTNATVTLTGADGAQTISRVTITLN